MSQDREFNHVLDEALAALTKGQNVPTVLQEFPEEAKRLAPLLETAQFLRRIPRPEPPTGAVAASKARMMRMIGKNKAAGPHLKEDVAEDLGMGFHQDRGKGLILAAAILALVFILLSTICVSAWQSLPGSTLYQTKLTLQDLHVLLTFDPEIKQERSVQYHQIRIEDLQKAVELKRLREADAQATLTAMPTEAGNSSSE